jgi:hypothetical protein
MCRRVSALSRGKAGFRSRDSYFRATALNERREAVTELVLHFGKERGAYLARLRVTGERAPVGVIDFDGQLQEAGAELLPRGRVGWRG